MEFSLLVPTRQRWTRHGAGSRPRATVPVLFKLLPGATGLVTALVFAQPRYEGPETLAGAPDPLRDATAPILGARAMIRHLGHELAEAVLDLLRP